MCKGHGRIHNTAKVLAVPCLASHQLYNLCVPLKYLRCPALPAINFAICVIHCTCGPGCKEGLSHLWAEGFLGGTSYLAYFGVHGKAARTPCTHSQCGDARSHCMNSCTASNLNKLKSIRTFLDAKSEGCQQCQHCHNTSTSVPCMPCVTCQTPLQMPYTSGGACLAALAALH